MAMATTVTPPLLDDSTTLIPKRLVRARPLFDREIVGRAVKDSFVKLNPATLLKNPVMFVVEVGAALTTVFLIRDAIIGALTFFPALALSPLVEHFLMHQGKLFSSVMLSSWS